MLENVTTYLLADPEQREQVLERLDELVVKPTGESGGKGVFIGPGATDEQIARQARRACAREPERWIAQELVRALDRARPRRRTARSSPRHVDLRPFAVFGEEIRIVPGGLTRVALREGSMIVNSSQGGGSKDTWVLEDGDDAPDGSSRAAAAWSPPALPDLRTAALDRPAAAAAAAAADARPDRPRAVLARPPPLARRAHRADARRRLPRRPPGPPGDHRRRRGSPGTALLAIMGAERRRSDGHAATRSSPRLTLDREHPASVLALRDPARARAPARVRDVFSAEMWEAINTFHLGLLRRDVSAALRAGPVLASTPTSRSAAALFWGVTGPDDAARRGARVPRGGRRDRGRPTWCCGCCASRCPRRRRRTTIDTARRPGARAAAGRRRLPGLPPRDAAPPNAAPVGALPALRARLPGLRRRVGRVAARGAHGGRRQPAPLRARAAARRGCWPTSSSARGARGGRRRELPRRSRSSSASSRSVDADIAQRYFGGASPARAEAHHALMHFAIRYLTEYRYERAGHRQPQRAARHARRRPRTSACDDFGVRVEPETRLRQHIDYFGTDVIEFGISKPHERLTIDVRARVATLTPPAAARAGWARGRRSRPTAPPAASSCCRARPSRRPGRARRARRATRAPTRRWRTLDALVRADPGPLRVPHAA